jgi:FtsH-binding integral membrane protein
MSALCLAATAVFPVLATFADRVPGVFFGLPLLALASLIFAATHHEDPAAIGIATVHWTVWIGGILGVVLAVVLLLGTFS